MEQPAEDMVLEELTRTECLAHLAAHQVGRIAVVVDGRPVILPVNYRVDDATVVFRTDAGTKLRGAALSEVAFEIDQIDEVDHQGWSVVVHGVGEEITDTIDSRSEALRVLPVSPWAPGDKAHWIKVVPRVVTGRWLHRRVAT